MESDALLYEIDMLFLYQPITLRNVDSKRWLLASAVEVYAK